MVKRKICFVSLNLYPLFDPECGIPFAGGAEVQQSIVARGLNNDGYIVSIVTHDYGQPDESVFDGVMIINAYRPQCRNKVPKILLSAIDGHLECFKKGKC